MGPRGLRSGVLLATTVIVIAILSFHARNDNDLFNAGKASAGIHLPHQARADTCPACELQWVAAVGPRLSQPLIRPQLTVRIDIVVPEAPALGFLSPVQSRPPPAA